MRNRAAVLIFLSIGMACSPQADDLKKEILSTDRAFSAMSKEKGMSEAFIQYAADEVIKPTPHKQPIVGKEALIKSFEGAKNDFELTWEPLKAEVEGNLGYTFGNWFLKTKTPNQRDTTLYGNYVSIWRKQADGTWNYVLDTGNPTPAPSKLE